MKAIDVGLLLVCAIGIFISLKLGSSVSLQLAWVQPTNPDAWSNHRFPTAEELPPSPIVTDLDGDGRAELVLATRDCTLEVYDIPSEFDGTYAAARSLPLVRSASLLRDFGVRTGRYPVAISTGYVSGPIGGAHNHAGDGGGRALVVVVVTSGWTVMMFDHRLNLVWESTVQESVDARAYHGEVAILIDHRAVRLGDSGVVFVGGRLSLPDDADDADVSHHSDGASASMDEQHMRGLSHFSYYALDGATGAVRWSHEPGDFERETDEESSPSLVEDELKRMLSPAHFRLHVGSRRHHVGEVDWREFEADVMASLPHAWANRGDTSFALANFARKHRIGRDAKGYPTTTTTTTTTSAPSTSPTHHRGVQHTEHMARDDVGIPQRHPARKAVGMLANLFSTSSDAASQPQDPSPRAANPNVLVAHTSRGIEVVHMYTGRPLCQMALQDGLYADLDGDGEIERARVITGDLSNLFSGPQASQPPSTIDDPSVGTFCQAYVTSMEVVGPRVRYNRTVCRSQGGLWGVLDAITLRTKRITRKQRRNDAKVTSVDPIVVESRDTPFRRARKGELDTIYLINNGRMTSIAPNGRQNWHVQTPAAWGDFKDVEKSWFFTPKLKPLSKAEEADVPAHPQLVVFPSSSSSSSSSSLGAWAPNDAQQTLILAVGQSMAVVDTGGNVVCEVGLASDYGVPIAPVVLVDIDGDGATDVLVTTRTGHHAFLLKTTNGSYGLLLLLGTLILAILAIFAWKRRDSLIAAAAQQRGDDGSPSSTSRLLRRSEESVSKETMRRQRNEAIDQQRRAFRKKTEKIF